MFFWRLQNVIKTALAAVVTLFIGVLLYCNNVIRFSAFEGERVFYMNSASSQGLRKESLQLCDLFNIKGESVRFPLRDKTQEQLLAEVLSEYNATVLFCERAAGVVSYYGYTPQFSNGIFINGAKVNLHIAFNEATCVIGSPIIFDGF